jgi:hypothetical protein
MSELRRSAERKMKKLKLISLWIVINWLTFAVTFIFAARAFAEIPTVIVRTPFLIYASILQGTGIGWILFQILFACWAYEEKHRSLAFSMAAGCSCMTAAMFVSNFRPH